MAAAAVLIVAGCTVGPDFVRPQLPPAAGYTAGAPPQETASAKVAAGAAQRFDQQADIPAQWWDLFGSPSLDALVKDALASNPNLAAAQAALRVARENARAQRGVYYPSVDGNFSAIRERVPPQIASPVSSNATTVSLYSASVGVTYNLDVFGGERRQVESAEAQAEAQRFQLEAAYLTLTSNVVAAVVQEAALRAQIAATQRIIALESQSLSFLQRERDLGEAATPDVAAQQAALAQAQTALPPLQKQLAQQRDQLTALLGRLPSDEPAQTFRLADIHLPQDLPLSLPSKLVDQRPDIRMAEANLHSASAQVGVAIANRLPNITLGGAYGGQSTSITDLLSPSSAAWDIAGSIAQPIFHGGTLVHQERAAKAAYDEAAADYRSTVVSAFQNVADTLHALQSDADALAAAVRAQHAAQASLDAVQARMKLAATNYLTLLNAEATYQQALIAVVQAQTARYLDTVALFQALGGGWWNRSDTKPATAQASR